MSVDSVNNVARATDRGTKVVKPGNEMDKNAFLRILSAELTNQDPENTKDSTQYVAQMAQFSSLEQMANLNSNVTYSGATSLLGKSVSLNVKDANGDPYIGTVKGVIKDGGAVKVDVEVMENDKKVMKTFAYEDVVETVIV